VKISFTVDLNEVPRRISSLIKEAAQSLDAEAQDLYDSAVSLSDDCNPTQILESINQARIALMGADLRLEDCQALLASYQNTQAQLSSEGIQQEQREISE
tara:strand:+ start:149 stop:448 length:300 start_codon:yes stop_codon:yes gene_type:complete